MPELTGTPVNSTPWWFWLVALVGVPFAAIGMFAGFCEAFGWNDPGIARAIPLAALIAWAALITLGEHLEIDRTRTGVGVVLATAATPAWVIAGFFLWLTIACPEAGCFD